MTGLNAKNSDLIDLLTATNNKLDAILTALGAPPPTATITLEDIKDVLDAISTKATSIDDSLIRIRDAISPLDDPTITEERSSISWAVYRIMLSTAIPWGQIVESDFYRNGIWDIIGQHVDTDLSVLSANLNSITDILVRAALNIGLDASTESQEYTGYLFDTLDWMGRISGALGLPVEANNRDVIQLLAKAADRPESQIGSGLAPYDICSDAYISSGMTLIPYNILEVTQAIVFAVFPDPPPTGVSFGTIFGVGIDNTELHITDDNWAGWTIYVASSANNFAMNSSDISTTLNRYPTNVWLDLSFLNTNLSVFVAGADSLRVYLCGGSWGPGGGGGGPWGGGGGGGGGFGWTECETIDSVAATYSTDSPFSLDIQAIPFDTLGGLTLGNTWFDGANNNEISVANTVIYDNMNGVKVTLISGANVRVYWINSTGSADHHDISSPDEDYTIPVDTTAFLIGNFPASSPSTHPFTIEICPAV